MIIGWEIQIEFTFEVEIRTKWYCYQQSIGGLSRSMWPEIILMFIRKNYNHFWTWNQYPILKCQNDSSKTISKIKRGMERLRTFIDAQFKPHETTIVIFKYVRFRFQSVNEKSSLKSTIEFELEKCQFWTSQWLALERLDCVLRGIHFSKVSMWLFTNKTKHLVVFGGIRIKPQKINMDWTSTQPCIKVWEQIFRIDWISRSPLSGRNEIIPVWTDAHMKETTDAHIKETIDHREKNSPWK